jgi:hypothetical protein
MIHHNVPLQPLRIPTGWTVKFNDLRHLEPTTRSPSDVNVWEHYKEDLLQLVHYQHQVLVDLGWYPDAQPAGVFRAMVIHHSTNPAQMIESWQTPIISVESRSQAEVVGIIEGWLQHYGSTIERS